MAKNYNIQTVSKYLDPADDHIVIGSSVAAGMTRYVTFLRVIPSAAGGDEGSKVFFCSTTASDTASDVTTASATQKLVAFIASQTAASTKEVVVPERPNTEHPLFTIAESKWFIAYLCSAVGHSFPAYVHAQYYDE